MLESHLEHFTGLPKGWYDKEQGERISPQIVELTRSVAHALQRFGVLELRLYPAIDGGVSVEWSNGDLLSEVSVEPDMSLVVSEFNETTRRARETPVDSVDAIFDFFVFEADCEPPRR